MAEKTVPPFCFSLLPAPCATLPSPLHSIRDHRHPSLYLRQGTYRDGCVILADSLSRRRRQCQRCSTCPVYAPCPAPPLSVITSILYARERSTKCLSYHSHQTTLCPGFMTPSQTCHCSCCSSYQTDLPPLVAGAPSPTRCVSNCSLSTMLCDPSS